MSQGCSWKLPSRRLCGSSCSLSPSSLPHLWWKEPSPGFCCSLRCLYIHFLCPFVEASLASAYGEGWLFLLSSGHLHRQRIPRFPAPGLSAELWTLRILQAGQQAGYLIMQCLLHASSSVCTRFPSSSCLQLKLPFLTLAHTRQSSSSGLYLLCLHFGERYFFLQKLLKAGPEQQSFFSVLNFILRDRHVHRVRNLKEPPGPSPVSSLCLIFPPEEQSARGALGTPPLRHRLAGCLEGGS